MDLPFIVVGDGLHLGKHGLCSRMARCFRTRRQYGRCSGDSVACPRQPLSLQQYACCCLHSGLLRGQSCIAEPRLEIFKGGHSLDESHCSFQAGNGQEVVPDPGVHP